jgi:hypothetical protein
MSNFFWLTEAGVFVMEWGCGADQSLNLVSFNIEWRCHVMTHQLKMRLLY